jgi:ATP-binding protein involved in chromosome partitioning
MASPAQGVTQSVKNRLLPKVKHVLPVASGKGGVGKSTVSANLALALAKLGQKVGLMDADVYGPSIPTILGIHDKPAMVNDRLVPVEKFGVKVMSMGFFVPANDAVIWRGPMLHKMVQDFLGLVEWGELDTLIVDLPPGTGDIQLSLCQTIPVTGAVIVSTPQDVAWNVAQKAIVMFDKLNAPILGIIENMSHHVCVNCGTKEDIFGTGGARRAAGVLGIPYLGSIPIEISIRRTSDEGDPVVHSHPESASAKCFFEIAQKLTTETTRRHEKGDEKKIPIKFGPVGQPQVEIEWNDGVKTSHSARELRFHCPCASCVNELTGERKIKLEWVPQNMTAQAFYPVGRYAVQIVWSDGHNTGLYGYDFLRKTSSSVSSV